MPLLLDTSVAIALLDGDQAIFERRHDQADVAFLSVVSRLELIPGLYRDGLFQPRHAEHLAAFLDEVELLPFTSNEVDAYSAIIASRGFSRRLVVDRMVAATALANDLTLATLNPRDFCDIPGLGTEDWSS